MAFEHRTGFSRCWLVHYILKKTASIKFSSANGHRTRVKYTIQPKMNFWLCYVPRLWDTFVVPPSVVSEISEQIHHPNLPITSLSCCRSIHPLLIHMTVVGSGTNSEISKNNNLNMDRVLQLGTFVRKTTPRLHLENVCTLQFQ